MKIKGPKRERKETVAQYNERRKAEQRLREAADRLFQNLPADGELRNQIERLRQGFI